MKGKIVFELLALTVLLACSSSNFQGANGDGAPKPEPAVEKQPNAIPSQEPVPTSVPPTTLPTSKTDSAQPTIEENTTIQPDEIVDGQEVINDCKKCVERAVQLSSQAGFTASKDITSNLGFYKIDPSRNLCDIHFLADFSVEIDDHEGQDSVGNNQVILYCPCDCGWARDLSVPGDLNGPGGGFGPDPVF